MVISDRNPAVLRSRKLSEFRLEPFHGRENNSVRGTKIEANSQNFVPNHFAKRKQFGIPFHGTKIEANSQNTVLSHSAMSKIVSGNF